MANTLMSLLVRLGVDSSDYKKGLDDAEGQAKKTAGGIGGAFSSIGSGLAGVGKMAGAAIATAGFAAAAGVAAVVKESIDMNAFLEKSTLQFTTLMGDADAAKAHVQSLFKFAAQTPYESSEVIQASKNLLTFGGAALNTEKNLNMVGDAAAAVGQPIGDVSFWMGRAYSMIQAGKPFGEAAMRLQEMGIMSAGVRSKLEQLQKDGASGAVVWGEFSAEMNKFSGAMKLQAGTMEGLTSSIKDNLGLAMSTALKPFFDMFKTGLENMLAFTTSETFTNWMNIVSQVAGQVVVKIQEIQASFGNLQSNAGTIWQTLSQAIGAAWAEISKWLDFFSNWWIINGPGITAAAQTMINGIVTLFSDLQARFGPFIQETFAKLSQWFLENGPLIQKFLQTLADGFTNYVVPAVVAAVDLFMPLVQGIIDIIGKLVTMFMQLVTGDWAGAWQSFTGIVETAVGTVVTYLNGVLELITKVLTSIGLVKPPTAAGATVPAAGYTNPTGTNYAAPSTGYSYPHAAGGMFTIPHAWGNEGFPMGSQDTASGGENMALIPQGQTLIDYDRMAMAFVTALQRAG